MAKRIAPDNNLPGPDERRQIRERAESILARARLLSATLDRKPFLGAQPWAPHGNPNPPTRGERWLK